MQEVAPNRADDSHRRSHMTERVLTREEQMLVYFVSRCDGQLGRTQLMKFMYLSDYEARRYLGHPLSSIEYVWHHYGPWDSTLQKRIDGLIAAGILRQDEVQYPNGNCGFLYRWAGGPLVFTFDPIELQVLAFVCSTYGRMPLASLLSDVVYQTEPMLMLENTGTKGQLLDMSMVDDAKRHELGVPYDELVHRSEHARAGHVLDHATAMEQVRRALADAAA